MITSVTLSRGAARMARRRRHRQAPGGDPEPGQHRHSVQRQDGHADDREDDPRAGVDARRQDSPCGPGQLACINSAFRRPGSADPLNAALLRSRGRRTRWRIQKSTSSRSTSSDGGRPSSWTRPARRLLITKGAPESVLSVVHGRTIGRAARRRPWTKPRAARPRDVPERSARRVYRVLAVACRRRGRAGAYTRGRRARAGAGRLRRVLGSRPPGRGAATIEGLHRDGVTSRSSRGDNEPRHATRLRGRSASRRGRLVPETTSMRLTDPALARVAERPSVFARVSPAQKNRILLALKTARATWSGSWETASTMRRRCMQPTSAFPFVGRLRRSAGGGRHHSRPRSNLARPARGNPRRPQARSGTS